jgi:hypothetical protein
VGQQVAHQDRLAATAGAFREVARDRRVQVDAPLLGQDQDGRGGGQHFRERGDVEHGVVPDRGCAVIERDLAERARIHAPAMLEPEHGARHAPVRDHVCDGALDRRRARAFEAAVRHAHAAAGQSGYRYHREGGPPLHHGFHPCHLAPIVHALLLSSEARRRAAAALPHKQAHP